jgi:peptidoglycan/LPS O-acetylase OafA/YrhL
MYQQPKRIEFLDSIRGIAALSVLLYHSTMFEWPAGVTDFIRIPVINVLFDGKAAVAMFFVLSGFVLSRPYLRPQKPSQMFLPTFYLRRITRIWIPWFFVFCFSAVVIRYFFQDYDTIPPYGREDVRYGWHFPLNFWGALRQMALISLPHPDNVPYLLPQDWSLGVELKASLLIPLFIFLARGKRIVCLLLVAVLLMFVSAHGYYVSFVLGVALARTCDQLVARVSAFPRYVLWLLFGLGIMLYQSRHIAIDLFHWPESYSGYFWVLNSIGCVVILTAILAHAGMQHFLQQRTFVFLGKISYSIYLFHVLILICIQTLILYSLNSMGITQTVILLPLSLGSNIFLTIALAAWTHRYVEVPSIDFGHWLTAVIQRRFLKR